MYLTLIWPADARNVVASSTEIGDDGQIVAHYQTRADLAQAVRIMADIECQDLEARMETGLEMIRRSDNQRRFARLTQRLTDLLNRHQRALSWSHLGAQDGT